MSSAILERYYDIEYKIISMGDSNLTQTRQQRPEGYVKRAERACEKHKDLSDTLE